MSTTTRSPTSIYVGAIIAIVGCLSVGIILRIMAVRRMRTTALARQHALAAPSMYPRGQNSMGMQGYYTPPAQPPRSYNLNQPQNWNRYPQSEPAPPYQPPASPPPASPRMNSPNRFPRTSFVAPAPQPVPLPVVAPNLPPRFPVPQTSPPSSPLSRPDPSFPLSPTDTGSRIQSMSLVDRMREVQTLMLEIHGLEGEPSNPDNRAKIQDLQRRVTELSDVADSNPQVVPPAPANSAPREPPPYGLDGRDDP